MVYGRCFDDIVTNIGNTDEADWSFVSDDFVADSSCHDQVQQLPPWRISRKDKNLDLVYTAAAFSCFSVGPLSRRASHLLCKVVILTCLRNACPSAWVQLVIVGSFASHVFVIFLGGPRKPQCSSSLLASGTHKIWYSSGQSFPCGFQWWAVTWHNVNLVFSCHLLVCLSIYRCECELLFITTNFIILFAVLCSTESLCMPIFNVWRKYISSPTRHWWGLIQFQGGFRIHL